MKLAVDRLPKTARRLVELIGFVDAMAFIREYSGLDMVLSQGLREDGRDRFEAVAELVGEEKARVLATEFKRGRLAVPVCYSAMKAVRDAMVVDEYDALVGQGLNDSQACHTLVRKYRTCERNIRRIIKQGRRVDQVVDTAQLKLF